MGGVFKYRVAENVDVAGRIDMASTGGVTITIFQGLGIYNFVDLPIDKNLVPYAGGGISMWNISATFGGFGVSGNMTGLVGCGGVNYFINPQVSITGDVSLHLVSGATGFQISGGATYGF